MVFIVIKYYPKILGPFAHPKTVHRNAADQGHIFSNSRTFQNPNSFRKLSLLRTKEVDNIRKIQTFLEQRGERNIVALSASALPLMFLLSSTRLSMVTSSKTRQSCKSGIYMTYHPGACFPYISFAKEIFVVFSKTKEEQCF